MVFMIKQNLYDVLKAMLAKRQEKDPDSSLRTFAKDLGISPSRLSLLLNNKIDLTRELLEKIYHGNKLEGDEKRIIQECFEHYYLKSQVQTTRDLNSAEVECLSGWERDALLKYLDAQVGPTDLDSLARYFSLSKERIQQVLEALMSLGLVALEGHSYETVDNVKLNSFSPNIDKLKASYIELSHKAGASLASCPEDLLSFVNHTFSVPVDQIPKIKKIISRCVSEIEDCVVHYKKGDVFHLSVQLFPMNTQGKDSQE